MIWTYFNNEQRQNPKEGFKYETKRKQKEVKMGRADQEGYHSEGKEQKRISGMIER